MSNEKASRKRKSKIYASSHIDKTVNSRILLLPCEWVSERDVDICSTKRRRRKKNKTKKQKHSSYTQEVKVTFEASNSHGDSSLTGRVACSTFVFAFIVERERVDSQCTVASDRVVRDNVSVFGERSSKSMRRWARETDDKETTHLLSAMIGVLFLVQVIVGTGIPVTLLVKVAVFPSLMTASWGKISKYGARDLLRVTDCSRS